MLHKVPVYYSINKSHLIATSQCQAIKLLDTAIDTMLNIAK